MKRTGTCENCRWWAVPDVMEYDEIVRPVDPDSYEQIPTHLLGFEVRRCTSPRLVQFERPTDPDQASICDGSGYRAVLYTGPQFGCTNYEEPE